MDRALLCVGARKRIVWQKRIGHFPIIAFNLRFFRLFFIGIL
jgi:hypothetical protein